MSELRAQTEAPTQRRLVAAKLVGNVIGIGVAIYILGPIAVDLVEPTDPPKCENVQAVDVIYRTKATLLVLESTDPDRPRRQWHTGAYTKPFSPDYRGPAVLVVRKGRWTKSDHVRLYPACPLAAGPS